MAWHDSPGRWLMPPDRLRLQRCVQRVCVCVSVCNITFIRVMGGKPHSWGKDFRGFVLFAQTNEIKSLK